MAGETPPGNAPAISDEVMAALETRMTSIINSALSAREKQSDRIRAKEREEFDKKLAEALAKGTPTDPPEDKSGKGKNKDDVEIATLRKKLEELAMRSDTFELRAKEERAKSRHIGLKTAVTDALTRQYGMDGVRAKGALTQLVADGLIAYEDDDSDAIVYRGEDGIAVDFQTGLRSWVKTPDAQIYLPPKGTSGSGGRPGGTGGFGNNGKPTREQQIAHLGALLDKEL